MTTTSTVPQTESIRSYPDHVELEGEKYAFERILKDDFFSVNILYVNGTGRRYVLKLSDFRFLFGWVFRPLAGWMSRREYKIYQKVQDIPGIPRLGPRFGRRGYFHAYIEGKTLFELESGKRVPKDFFDQLSRILSEIHRRRIFYVDLNKRGNIICSTEGKAYLIDFQICLPVKERSGVLGKWVDRVFYALIREDHYHLFKHKKAFQPDLLTDEEKVLARRSSLNQSYSRWIWRPYITVKRLIYPHGSNETVWYKWKKEKDQTPRMS